MADIVAHTGLKRSFVSHARHAIRKPKSVLAGAIEDAEVIADCWRSRAENFDARWAEAPPHEKEQLIGALRACRSAATKIIQRLNKEAKGERNEIPKTEAV